MISLINHDSRVRSQWGRYNLPRCIYTVQTDSWMDDTQPTEPQTIYVHSSNIGIGGSYLFQIIFVLYIYRYVLYIYIIYIYIRHIFISVLHTIIPDLFFMFGDPKKKSAQRSNLQLISFRNSRELRTLEKPGSGKLINDQVEDPPLHHSFCWPQYLLEMGKPTSTK